MLFLNANPNASLTCVDIGEHQYVRPCYNKIKEFYGDRINLLIGSSVDVLPKLTQLYDLIHIDGSHSEHIAREDIINSYYLSKNDAILIMDDYDIPILNNLWNEFTNIFKFNDVNFKIFLNKYQSIKQLNKYQYINDAYKEILNDKQINYTIPKIVHHIAPCDKTKWHPMWEECYKSWIDTFPEPEYEHKIWNDEDDLENFISNEFSDYLPIYKSYPYKIQRIDMSRYFILLKYGGIYADMDYYSLNNFYDALDVSKANIPFSPFTTSEILQNSLMAAPKNCSVFLSFIDESTRRTTVSLNAYQDTCQYVSYTTGPKLISDVYCRLQAFVNPLEKELYNPIAHKGVDNEFLYNKDTCYCKHFGTGHY